MAEVDYKALCEEIFGTADAGKIRALATQWKKRNAGRKRVLSKADLDEIDTMRQEGATVSQIAEHFGVSRPVVSQYINERPSKDYTMRIDFRLGKKTCTVIYVDFGQEQIAIQNRTDDLLHRAFGVNEVPTWSDFELFWRADAFPRVAVMPSRSCRAWDSWAAMILWRLRRPPAAGRQRMRCI